MQKFVFVCLTKINLKGASNQFFPICALLFIQHHNLSFHVLSFSYFVGDLISPFEFNPIKNIIETLQTHGSCTNDRLFSIFDHLFFWERLPIQQKHKEAV
jgi:hypothetical protein